MNTLQTQTLSTEQTDKIYKREHRGDPKLPKHEQDIYNLKQIVSDKKIDEQLNQIMKE